MTVYDKALAGGWVQHHGCYSIYKENFGDTCQAYDNGAIRLLSVVYHQHDNLEVYPNHITVEFRNGEVYAWKTKYIDSYNMTQFGIAVSVDGRYVFAQTWENGLFCFDARTGERIWRTKSRRGITDIFVNDSTIVCQQHDHAMLLLDIHTGDVLIEKRPCTAWGFTALDRHAILCQVTARMWELIDPKTLTVIRSFPHKDFKGKHPESCIKQIYFKEKNDN